MATLTQQIKAAYYMSLVLNYIYIYTHTYIYIYIMESPSLNVQKTCGCGAWGHGSVGNMTVVV